MKIKVLESTRVIEYYLEIFQNQSNNVDNILFRALAKDHL